MRLTKSIIMLLGRFLTTYLLFVKKANVSRMLSYHKLMKIQRHKNTINEII